MKIVSFTFILKFELTLAWLHQIDKILDTNIRYSLHKIGVYIPVFSVDLAQNILKTFSHMQKQSEL